MRPDLAWVSFLLFLSSSGGSPTKPHEDGHSESGAHESLIVKLLDPGHDLHSNSSHGNGTKKRLKGAHDGVEEEEEEDMCAHHETITRYMVATFHFCHVRGPLVIVLWIILVFIAEIVFHLSKRVSEHFPDSALLIALGILVGGLMKWAGYNKNVFLLRSNVFFLYLLPPVVFEAGYFMPTRAFYGNLGTILCYAVIGTLFNVTCIGLSLWGVSFTGIFAFSPEVLPVLKSLLFASLICAVDPVAVLVVFEEIHVNEVLFIVIFGESLLNDGVSVVLYKVFSSFTELHELSEIVVIDYFAGFFSFFVIALVGVGLGIVCGMFACFVTRFSNHVRVLEPLVVMTCAYLSYLLAEMFGLSGILAIVSCGLTMKEYLHSNISRKSQTTLKYFLKMGSRSCEGIMFIFLGLSAVSSDHYWSAEFIVLAIVFCLVYRFLGVIIQTAIINKYRVKKLTWLDQFIMGYSGLRGLIAYGLVEAIDAEVVGEETKRAFVTATIIVILFTVFVQGTTIKPLVNRLKVAKDEEEKKSMHHTVISDSIDHVMTGMESILGIHGHNWLRAT